MSGFKTFARDYPVSGSNWLNGQQFAPKKLTTFSRKPWINQISTLWILKLWESVPKMVIWIYIRQLWVIFDLFKVFWKKRWVSLVQIDGHSVSYCLKQGKSLAKVLKPLTSAQFFKYIVISILCISSLLSMVEHPHTFFEIETGRLFTMNF